MMSYPERAAYHVRFPRKLLFISKIYNTLLPSCILEEIQVYVGKLAYSQLCVERTIYDRLAYLSITSVVV